MQPLFRQVSLSTYLALTVIWGLVLFYNSAMSIADDKMPTKTASVEGMNEYALDNGLKILLFSDKSQPKFTINSTIFAGARHEGDGEAYVRAHAPQGDRTAPENSGRVK
jgi:zinc protease